MMTPTTIEIGGLALIVGMLALAQRLGGWQHRPLARCLGIAAAGLFVTWCFLFFPPPLAWGMAVVVWSIGLWFIFPWIRKSMLVDDTRGLPTASEIAVVPVDAPSLLVHYVKSDTWNKLQFSNEKPLTAIIRKIGPIVSRERYESVYSIDLLPSAIPPISFGNPFECIEASSVGLTAAIQGGTSKTVDSVVIDYDDSYNNQFSRQFTLARSLDFQETIAWIPGPICLRDQARTPVPEVESLAELRDKLNRAALYPKTHQAAQLYAKELEEEKTKRASAEQHALKRLAALKAAASDLPLTGQLTLLAEDALWLADQFGRILEENDMGRHTGQEVKDLSHPLSRSVLFLEPTDEGKSLSWQRSSLQVFWRRYEIHRAHVTARAPSAFTSRLLEMQIPNDLESSEITKMLGEHRTSLLDRAKQLMETYAETLLGESI